MTQKFLTITALLITSLLFTQCSKSNDETLAPVPVVPKIVYTAGVQYIGRDVATVWKDSVPTALTDGTFNASANSVFVSGTDVYVAG